MGRRATMRENEGTGGDEPQTCTVELTTGAFVHLACTPGEVLTERQRFSDEGYAAGLRDATANPLTRFERVTGAGTTAWRDVWIDVAQVVAVYPIAGRPEPPMAYSVLTAGGMVPQGS